MIDELQVIRSLRPEVTPPDPVLLARKREDLMAQFMHATAREPRRRLALVQGRPHRSLAVAVLLIAVVGVAAGGWALTRGAAQATEVQCQFDPTSAHQIDSSSGSPIEDCGAEWRRLFDSSPPVLVAYDNGLGGITVVPAGEAVPNSWRRLTRTFRQDPRLIELDASLGDVGAGLESECTSLERARRIAKAHLDRLGLNGWSVVASRGAADGATTCTRHYLEREQRRVVLVPMSTSTDGDTRASAPYTKLAARLRDATRTCLTVEAATEVSRSEAASLGLDESSGEVVFHVIEGDACARVTTNVGGRVEVTIRGDRR